MMVALKYLPALLLISMVLLPTGASAEPKKVIKYRKHTQIDFSGEAVQGKIRTPEVFYIFQRKRATSHQVIHAPTNFSDHGQSTVEALRDSLGRAPAGSSGGDTP